MTKLRALPTTDFIGEPVVQPSGTDFEKYISEHSFDVKRVPEENDTVLYYKEIPIGSKSNVITITGKAKSRKSVVASAIATSFFKDPDSNFLGFNSRIDPDGHILHVDTEQGYKHYYEGVIRIFNDADVKDIPVKFTSIHTRDAEVKFRVELIEYMLEKYKPSALIIDGVTDLVYDINSQEEAVRIGEKILQWSSKYNLVVITVIHTTKTTGYMTGAIGTYLEKKCETSIKVEKDEKQPDLSHVSCQLSRNKSFPDFTILYDESIKRYAVLNEDQVTRKGKTGDKSPEAYAEDIHASILSKVFVVRDNYNDYELKRAIINNCKIVTGDELNNKLVSKWIQYYNERAMLFQNPNNMGWMRTAVPAQQTTLFTDTGTHEENRMPGGTVDDLPF